nr:hypothetical protein [Tanacetum cinerariifolium]
MLAMKFLLVVLLLQVMLASMVTEAASGNKVKRIKPPKPVKPVQELLTCKSRKSRCFMKRIKCPAECPKVKPKNPKDKACFLDCYSPKCEAVCKSRKPNCNGPGAACYDPRFIGGDGIVFYFHGKSNEHFSLLSDSDLQINARFIGLRPQGRTRDYTWIQALGLKFGQHNFTLEATKTEKWDDNVDHLKLSYDRAELLIPEGHSSEWNSNDGEIQVERTSTTNSLTVNIPDLAEISVNVIPVSEEDSKIHNYQIPQNDSFAHLEVQFRFFGLSSKVEGILGRTYRPDFENPAKPGVAMPVIGGDDKYKTSALLATDCALCLFSPEENKDEKVSPLMDYGMLDCKGEICEEWSRTIRTALRAKKKLIFIDGTMKEPDDKSPDLEDWWTVNSMLVAWMFNTAEQTLVYTITHMESAKVYAMTIQKDRVHDATQVKDKRDSVTVQKVVSISLVIYNGGVIDLIPLDMELGKVEEDLTVMAVEVEGDEMISDSLYVDDEVHQMGVESHSPYSSSNNSEDIDENSKSNRHVNDTQSEDMRAGDNLGSNHTSEEQLGKSNFSLWRIKIRALLKQQDIWAPIVGTKPDDMTDANYKLQEEKAHSTILLCLSDEVLYEFMQHPLEEHWQAIVRVVRSIKDSPRQGILLCVYNGLRLYGYCDSDWASCTVTRHSLIGYFVLFGNSPIPWKKKKQHIVSRSSSEAKYSSNFLSTSSLVSYSNADWTSASLLGVILQDIVFFVNNLLSLSSKRSTLCFFQVSKLSTGNVANGLLKLPGCWISFAKFIILYIQLVYLSSNPVQQRRSKHIEIDIHFVRDRITVGHVRIYMLSLVINMLASSLKVSACII